jgi:DNA topoisomerase VI subunit A
MRHVKRTIEDLALTIGVHPWAFGVRPEGTGHLVLSPGITVEATVVERMFAFRNRSDVATKTYKWRHTEGEIITIPAFVQTVKVRVGPTGIRAVVVVEHRNLKTLMAKPEAIPGVILVVTSGSAAASTTELLHMLDTELPDFPFLYISDHDFPGFQIYNNLKYGSNDRAYCSHISVCPRLQWVGPTKADLIASPAGYKEEKRKLHKAHHPNQSEAEVARILDAWEKAHSERIQAKLSRVNYCDQSLVRGWQRKDWLQYEPKVKAAVDVCRETAACSG